MKTLFNDGWQFAEIKINNEKTEAGEKTTLLSPEQFIDRVQNLSFANVEIPHDWLIGDTGNLYCNSVGFYKKTFQASDVADKYSALRFEGVYMNSAVYVNGSLAGVWKYGYTTFELDISSLIKTGTNSILVIVVYQNPNSRWYSGAGIYRDVYLVRSETTRFVPDGIYIVNRKTENGEWYMTVETEISSETKSCFVRHSLKDANGTTVADSRSASPLIPLPDAEAAVLKKAVPIASGKLYRDRRTIRVPSPLLWDIEHPNVYTLTSELVSNDGTIMDTVKQHTGFKTIVLDSDKGCFLNGRHVKIHGACQHHDLGALGAAFNLQALRRQFEKLRTMGINSIRTSHNPPAPAFMDLADSMGFLIDDECFDMWQKSKTTYDYGNYFDEWHERDVAAWVRRDRNHPSLFMWSIGNEIYDTHFGNGLEVTKDLKSIVRTHDPDKNGLVTIASNYMDGDGAQNCAKELDAVGYNYAERLYANHRVKYPDWCIYGSETSSTVQSRGIYHFPANFRLLTYDDLQCSSLGNCTTTWGAKSTSKAITDDRDTDSCIGQYIWTGWDYIGEPTPYFTKNSYFGQIDTAGFEKDTYWLYRAEWTDYRTAPFVHLLPYWDFNEGQLIDVRIYSNAPVTELFLNGKSFGTFGIDHKNGTQLSGHWQIPFDRGTLKAVAYDEKGRTIAEDIRQTPDDPDRLILSVEKGKDDDTIFFIDISASDRNGLPVENARNSVTVRVDGNASLCGLDNGDSTDYDQYVPSDGKSHTRRLFSNRLLAIVKTNNPYDKFDVFAASRGLKPAGISHNNAGFTDTAQLSDSEKLPVPTEIVPVRKIELSCTEPRRLTQQHRSVTVTAKIYPENATFTDIVWRAMMAEGVESNLAVIDGNGSEVSIKGISDGNFRLRCTCDNGRNQPEVVSELEFEVVGIGTGNLMLDPYKIIPACKYSHCLHEPKLSFKGGIFTTAERNWFSFDKIDFGKNGADEMTVPIFSFQTELPLEIWEGNPDERGTLLLACTYKAPSVYNTYTENTFILPKRLFGVHNISIVTTVSLSLGGFRFAKTPKAFSKLAATDNTTITGDSFRITKDAVTEIGNNVSLEFGHMDFGTVGCSQLSIYGRSHTENNTIMLRFEGEDGTDNRMVEFPFSDGYEEKTFPIEKVCGSRKVSFIFLPGCSFDFKWFRFS